MATGNREIYASSANHEARAIKIYPEIPLTTEWQRQANSFIELGFHTELNLTKKEYFKSLPKFEAQPEEYRGRLDIPVIVETRIPLERMFILLDIYDHFSRADSVKNWEKDEFETPKTPYTTWLKKLNDYLDVSANAVRKTLKPDERGGNFLDGIAFYLSNPYYKDHYFYLGLPGSQDDSGHNLVPCLSRIFKDIEIEKIYDDMPNDVKNWIVAGRRINTKV